MNKTLDTAIAHLIPIQNFRENFSKLEKVLSYHKPDSYNRIVVFYGSFYNSNPKKQKSPQEIEEFFSAYPETTFLVVPGRSDQIFLLKNIKVGNLFVIEENVYSDLNKAELEILGIPGCHSESAVNKIDETATPILKTIQKNYSGYQTGYYSTSVTAQIIVCGTTIYGLGDCGIKSHSYTGSKYANRVVRQYHRNKVVIAPFFKSEGFRQFEFITEEGFQKEKKTFLSAGDFKHATKQLVVTVNGYSSSSKWPSDYVFTWVKNTSETVSDVVPQVTKEEVPL